MLSPILSGISAAHSSCTSRRIIGHAVGSWVIRHRIALMVWIVGDLARVRSRVVHVMRWATHHVWVAGVVIVGSAVMAVRNVIMTVHNRIWIRTVSWVMMLPVRTWIVHLSRMFLVGILISHGRSVLDPMTTI